jgi:hypothetical protein
VAHSAALIGSLQLGFVQAVGAAAAERQHQATEFWCLDPHWSPAAFATQPPNLRRRRGLVEVIILTLAKMKAPPLIIVNVDQPARKADWDRQPKVMSLVMATAGYALDETVDKRHRSGGRQRRETVSTNGSGLRGLITKRLDLFG